MSNRVVHFEIQADDIDRAKLFYESTLGWKFEDWSSFTGTVYWGIVTGDKDTPGINGGLLQRPAPIPNVPSGTNSFVCTVQVDNYDEVEQKILAAGGKVALAKAALPGMAWQGYYLDTEGNTFGIHQPDEKAR